MQKPSDFAIGTAVPGCPMAEPIPADSPEACPYGEMCRFSHKGDSENVLLSPYVFNSSLHK